MICNQFLKNIMASKVVSKPDCLRAIEKFVESHPERNKNQSLKTFEICTKNLLNFGIYVTNTPIEKDLRSVWFKEKNKILAEFRKVVDAKNTGKWTTGIFYNSSQYSALTSLEIVAGNDMQSCDVVTVKAKASRRGKKRKKRGRPKGAKNAKKKPLLELKSDTQIRERLNKSYHSLLKDCSEEGVAFDKMAAKLCMRYYYTVGENYSKEKGDMFSMIFNGKNPYEHFKLDVEKSNFIQERFDFGKRPYTQIRQFLLPYVELASADRTRAFRKIHQPKLDKCHDDGVWAPLKDLVGRVTKSYLENLVEISPEIEKQIESGLIVCGTFGFDANGGNTVAKNCQNHDTSIILGGLKVWGVKDIVEKDVYIEQSSGPQTETPWFLIPSTF